MARLAELRKEAQSLGIPTAAIRGATTAAELEEVIAAFSGANSGNSKPRKKASSARKKATGRTAKRATARRSAPAAQSSKGKAKRPTTTAKRATTKRTSAKRAQSSSGNSGRNLLEQIDYDPTADGWNAREGSAPDRIIRALKRFRGDRDRVFTFLLPDIGDFMGLRKRDGSKRSKQEREDMLRYRISRTAWEYAVRTGQHDPSENRVQYGTGETGDGVWKPAKKTATVKRAPAKRASVKRSTAPRGRKASQTTPKRATPQKRSQGARRASTPKRTTAKRATAKRTTAKRTTARRTPKRRTVRR